MAVNPANRGRLIYYAHLFFYLKTGVQHIVCLRDDVHFRVAETDFLLLDFPALLGRLFKYMVKISRIAYTYFKHVG